MYICTYFEDVMYKKKISYLLHSLTSFILMLIVVRLLNIFIGDSLDSYLTSQIVFLASSFVAVLAYKIMPRDITPDDTEEIPDPVPPMAKRDPLNCLVCVVIAFCAMMGLMYIVYTFLGDSNSSAYPLSPLYVLSLVVVHPVIEEYLFRHLYYEELRLLTPVFAVVAQATMFALDHDTVGSMFTALFCGIVLALLVEATGRWYLAIIAHSLINLRTLIYTTILAEAPTTRNAADLVFYAIGIAALAALVVIRSKEKKTKDTPVPETEKTT